VWSVNDAMKALQRDPSDNPIEAVANVAVSYCSKSRALLLCLDRALLRKLKKSPDKTNAILHATC
jgi:hypothetical protein